MPILRFNKDKNEWDQIDQKDALDTDLRLNNLLKKKLDFGKKSRAKNNDVVGIICGAEGSGKSSLGGNVMRYMTDDKFDPTKDMIGSDEEDALSKLQNVPKGGNLMFDEGNVFFLSTETMKRQHRDLHKIFSIFRQKNLFVLIILPSFFRLGTYFALDRSQFLLRTYMKNGERGCFAYYGGKIKDNLYRIGKLKQHDYSVVQPVFRGKFDKCIQLESKEYLKFKEKTLEDTFFVAKKKKVKTPKEIEIEYRKKIINNNTDLTREQLSNLLGITPRRISQLKKEISLEN